MNRKEIFLMVIAAEIRSQRLYQALSKSFKDEHTSQVFHNLLLMEKNHEEKVTKAFLQEFPDAKIETSPAFEKEFSTLDLNDPACILEYAIAREDEAWGHYQSLAKGSSDAATKAMLLDFAAEEQNHKEVITDQMQQLQGGMTWFDPSELTGLQEH